jgi:ribosomal protein S18 acetylase RimI-like enzyme
MKMSEITMRPRTNDDLTVLSHILVEVHALDGYPVEGVDDPMAWLVSDTLINAWVAERSGKVVGQVALSNPSSNDDAVALWLTESGDAFAAVAVLGRLFVHPDSRGYGIGRKLTETAVERAQQIGRRTVLDVMKKDAAAIRTYESLGWKCLGPIMHTFGDGRTEPALAYVSPEAPSR